MRALIVTAVAAEADSVAAGLTPPHQDPVTPEPRTLPGGYRISRRDLPGLAADVLVGGVGPAAAAAATATALALADYSLVISAGIGGGFAPAAPPGSLVVADALVAADLGAEGPDGFLSVDALGFGRSVHLPPAELAARAAEATGGLLAPVLTVSTVTGTAARAAELAARHPLAGAEAMEGFGVAEAAAAHGLPVLEIRAVSNAVGPRDRDAWRIGDALAALAGGFRVLGPVLVHWGGQHEQQRQHHG
ncbi:futalosine hydrolase [Streptomyces goshikiensis]|uniref:Futalosine hydrolase n=1 Tax=Streptomyces goshikiensis TaxID=1942 RepID=A0ABZ1RN58_9ACTN|nr:MULTISPECIES: futalosine hydrolase [Streptomyces]AKL66667.1 futalosine nucleosidase [Streptomyces sp. Mg1]MBP0934901.1 futalosine hydrolase [Streptomyces sp. KCTC 0041BP]OKI25390.1 futalosine hydrolase [Streptomyces sp. CB03578]PJN16015.1 futalosine hydrolase [Streptomyces sp. CB02120-2]RPK49893.1 Futalosine hydrolase [Streptomyces sp. ADI91-18]